MTQLPCAAPLSASGPLAALLLLTDGRFPAGGHAHSGGLEAAAACGRVHDIPTLEAFLHGRAETTGAVAAAFAAAACIVFGSVGSDRTTLMEANLLQLDAELEARIPSGALRAVSRKLGRQLLRALCVVRPDPRFDTLAVALPIGPHQPIAFGAATAAVDLDPYSAALAAVYESVTGPATAAIRLLGLNPFDVYAVLARLSARLDRLAVEAVARAAGPADELPSYSSPLLDIFAEHHAHWEMRLFAS
jgi:urease accessory protein